MLNVIVQIFAAVGPIALALMGVFISVWPPSPKGRSRWFWAGSFFAIGLLTALSLFRELRGTDSAIDDILHRISHIDDAKAKGPRLEFTGIKTMPEGDDIKPNVGFYNTSETDTVSWYMMGSIYQSESEPTQDLFDKIKRDLAKQQLPKLPKSTHITRGMGLGLTLENIPKEQTDRIYSQNKYYYVILIAKYIAEDTDSDHVFVTELCAKITKPFNDFSPCQKHNGYYYVKSDLSDLH